MKITSVRMFVSLLVSAVALLYPARLAEATWSVLAVDQRTGTVIIASATCVASGALNRMAPAGLMGVQAIVVPGKGVAAAQSAVDRTFANQQLIYAELQKGTPPADIMRSLAADERFQTRQYGILDLQGRMAQHSGSDNGRFSLHEGGALPGESSIAYSIQGNILTSDAVVQAAAGAFREASGTLADRVMAAMEAADREGGDNRCSCDNPRNPEVAAPCTAKTAHVAYILRAERSDALGESFNDGKYAMYISATDADIRPDEDANPVKTLRMRYDAWKQTRR